MTANPLVRARDLACFYRMSGGRVVKAVDGVGFDITRGETLALVGESGCGKSTTGRLLVRLVEPTAGTLTFDGMDITRLNSVQLRDVRRRMQLIFQDPGSSFNPRMDVQTLVAEPLKLASVSPVQQRQRVAELLPLVGLPAEYARRFPHEFSGGQRQRIGIARALALRPDFIVCDEPVSALDVSVQAQVINLLTDLQQSFGLTYLFISHDLRVVRHMATRIAVMYLGRIVEVAAKADLYRHPQHPYTRALLSAVPSHVPGRMRRREADIGEIASADAVPPGCRFHTRCPYVMPVCRTDDPALVDIAPGHSAACHLVTGHAAAGVETAPAFPPRPTHVPAPYPMS